MTPTAAQPLKGSKILVPRGGSWGAEVAASVRARGAFPIVAPLINFASPRAEDTSKLRAALERLSAGEYSWLIVTSATAVDVLHSMRARIPDSTMVAAVGETTAAALTTSGYRVDFVPVRDNSPKGLLVEWPDGRAGMAPLNILTLRNESSTTELRDSLLRRGHRIDSVVAYRTVGVPVPESINYDVQHGRIRAMLITSGSVAEQIHRQFHPVPESIKLAAIGPRTAHDARSLGLRVDAVPKERGLEALLDALELVAQGENVPVTELIDLNQIRQRETEARIAAEASKLEPGD